MFDMEQLKQILKIPQRLEASRQMSGHDGI